MNEKFSFQLIRIKRLLWQLPVYDMKVWSEYFLFYLSVLDFSFILIQEDKVQIQESV